MTKHPHHRQPAGHHGHANPGAAKPLAGPVFSEPVFAEGTPGPDPSGFTVPHPSDNSTYTAIEDLLTKQTVSFPPSRNDDSTVWSLAEAYGPQGSAILQRITTAGQIVFHATGDSGASESKYYPDEISVADQLTLDCTSATQDSSRPSFLLHLGDVVYDFGESKYYYDQFYAPFRGYPGPILSIAGNHDSFILPNTAANDAPLAIWMRNFCATEPNVTVEAGSLHRTAMTQPGVYFTLDAPFVRIICLFSNALEDPGLISSENNRWPGVPDTQLDFLTAQLQKIKTDKFSGAVLLAVHHPPFSYDPPAKTTSSGKKTASGTATHGSSPAMLQQIDTICKAAGVYPHAVISGHAHNYQRYTRTVPLAGKSTDVPFIICGSGGHHVNKLTNSKAAEPPLGDDVSYMDAGNAIGATGLTLEKYYDQGYGYLRITVDATQIAIGFYITGKSVAQSRYDMVTVDIASHQMIAN